MLARQYNTSKAYIPGLNGLRAVSILLVLMNHAFIKGPLDNMTTPWTFFADGGLGVNTFFVISGYLITTLLMREQALTHTVQLTKFYMRRVLRIFPAYYSLLLFYLLLQLLHVFQLSGTSWVTSVTFTKYFNKSDWPTNHLWSLSVEEHFYLLWPLGFIHLKNKGRRLLPVIIIVLVPAARLVNTYYLHTQWMDELSLFQRADAIACGCLLALHFDKITLAVDKLVQKSRLFVLLPLAILFGLYLLNEVPIKQPVANGLLTAFGTTTGLFANMAIVLLLVITISHKTLWQRVLSFGAVNYIGKISYGIYLWQQLFFSPWQQQFFSLHLNPLMALLVNIGCIILVASASYYVIEKPFLRLKARYAVAGAT